MKSNDKGMTLLEVVIAFTILSIGIGFMLMSNKAYFAFREQRQERQQMLFYAAGQMEAYLEGQVVDYSAPPYDNYIVLRSQTRSANNSYLDIIRIEVTRSDAGPEFEPVVLYSYRVRTL